jgi:hypothetical protein
VNNSVTDRAMLSVLDRSVDDLSLPHDTATRDLFELLDDNEDASHFTQEETVKCEEPVGSDVIIGADKYDPLDRVRIVLGKDVSLYIRLIPSTF